MANGPSGAPRFWRTGGAANSPFKKTGARSKALRRITQPAIHAPPSLPAVAALATLMRPQAAMSYCASILCTSDAAPAQDHRCVVSDDAPQASTASLLPPPMIESASPLEPMLTRCAVIDLKVALKEQRAQAARQTRGLQASAQRDAIYREIRACAEEEETLDKHLEQNFVPQHSPGQLLSPRAFSVSPLFRVCNKVLQRKTQIELLCIFRAIADMIPR